MKSEWCILHAPRAHKLKAKLNFHVRLTVRIVRILRFLPPPLVWSCHRFLELELLYVRDFDTDPDECQRHHDIVKFF